MSEPKWPEFDTCNGLRNVVIAGGGMEPPSIEPGMLVTLSYKKYLVTVKVASKVAQDDERFLGKVVFTNAKSENELDINVGDSVGFTFTQISYIGSV